MMREKRRRIGRPTGTVPGDVPRPTQDALDMVTALQASAYNHRMKEQARLLLFIVLWVLAFVLWLVL